MDEIYRFSLKIDDPGWEPSKSFFSVWKPPVTGNDLASRSSRRSLEPGTSAIISVKYSGLPGRHANDGLEAVNLDRETAHDRL